LAAARLAYSGEVTVKLSQSAAPTSVIIEKFADIRGMSLEPISRSESH
jgi:hypothetical protein